VKPNSPSEVVREASERLGLVLSPGQIESLRRFAELLRDRAVPLGVVSAADSDRLLSRHVIDSLRAAAAVRPPDRLAYDLGSGAGLPGLAVAVACPGLAVRLVESRRRRAAFLELAVHHLAVGNVAVVWDRVEDQLDPADLCFARAFAPLARAWAVARPLLVPGGRLVHFAGAAETPVTTLPGASSVEIWPSPLLDSPGGLAIITR